MSEKAVEGFKFPWPFPKNPSLFYKIRSAAMMTAVQTFTKSLFFMNINKIKVVNRERLIKLIEDRSRPLITVANHRSYIDDPLIWSLFSWREFFTSISRSRYTLAAHNVCFTKAWHTMMFSLCRSVPVVRGAGVYQKGMDFCIEKLADNHWVHIFPEGKVTPDNIRIKWGVARLVMESRDPPMILPIWINKTADIWPTIKPYYPRFGKEVSVVVGDALDMRNHLPKLGGSSEIETRKSVADFIQQHLFDLGKSASSQ